MRLRFHTFELFQTDPWTVSRESFDSTGCLIVELQHEGLAGLGEASAFMTERYDSSIDRMIAALRAVEPVLRDHDFDTPGALWERLAPQLSASPFAQCALDVAAHDLWGKLHGAPVHRLWGLDPADAPPTDFSIGLDTPEEMLRKMSSLPDWPIYKIKLGTPDDVALVRHLRAHTSAVFRVDANCGWDVDETLRKAEALAGLGVEFVEQPLPVAAWAQMKALRERCPLPLMADESCCEAADVARCAGHFDGVNIKLMKCGGLTPARRMVAEARALGLQVMAGCMPESSVGISALAQLAPLLDHLDADSPLLIANDVASGVGFDRGRLVYPAAPGIGATLH